MLQHYNVCYSFIFCLVLSYHYIVTAHNLTTLTAFLVAIKSLSMQVFRHAGRDIRWSIRARSSTELWDMFAILVTGFNNRRMLLADCCPVCARRTANMKYVVARRVLLNIDINFNQQNQLPFNIHHSRYYLSFLSDYQLISLYHLISTIMKVMKHTLCFWSFEPDVLHYKAT